MMGYSDANHSSFKHKYIFNSLEIAAYVRFGR
jgi:hypothetical protein